MIISHKYKFIFIKTRKTAGTSVEVYLSKHCASHDVLTPIVPHVDPHQPRNYSGYFSPITEIISNLPDLVKFKSTMIDLKQKNKFYNHIPAIKVQSRINSKVWKNYFKFCIERNPWDKTLSHYYHMNSKYGNGKWSFDEYLKSNQLCFNYPLYMDWQQSNVIVDKVVKYEQLNQDLTEVFQLLNIPFNGYLNVRAKSEYRQNRKPYWEVYTKEQKQLVSDLFWKEINLHNYSF